MMGFGDRLLEAFNRSGHLCVGLDPHPFLLNEWECSDSVTGLREFSFRVIDLCAEYVGIIKPQVAFFERFGSQGIDVLERVIERAHQAELLVISDAKRGDIGSTMEAYAQAWLTPDWSLSSDAITVSPYLGIDALASTVDYALSNNKGLFILAATSNPEAHESQSAVINTGEFTGKTVAAANLARISQWSLQRNPQLSIGAVLGATLDLESMGISLSQSSPIPVLAPGFGFQGARIEDAEETFGPLSKYLIVSETRSVLSGGFMNSQELIKRRVQEVGHALD